MSPETMEDEDEVELYEPTPITRTAAADSHIDGGRDPPRMQEGGDLRGKRVHLSGANEALAAVAEYLQAGVVESAEGKGAITDHSDLALGAAFWRESPLHAYVHSADVVLAVGSRLALVSFQPGQRIIQIDVDEQEIGRNHRNTFGLVGDARATLLQLLERRAPRRRRALRPRPSVKRCARDRRRRRAGATGVDLEGPARRHARTRS